MYYIGVSCLILHLLKVREGSYKKKNKQLYFGRGSRRKHSITSVFVHLVIFTVCITVPIVLKVKLLILAVF
jgi:hypothetical protein